MHILKNLAVLLAQNASRSNGIVENHTKISCPALLIDFSSFNRFSATEFCPERKKTKKSCKPWGTLLQILVQKGFRSNGPFFVFVSGKLHTHKSCTLAYRLFFLHFFTTELWSSLEWQGAHPTANTQKTITQCPTWQHHHLTRNTSGGMGNITIIP